MSRRRVPRERFDLDRLRGSTDEWPAPRDDVDDVDAVHGDETTDDAPGPYG